jgi:hypothetical protein
MNADSPWNLRCWCSVTLPVDAVVIESLAARDGASCRPRGDLPWPVLAGREGWDLDALCALPLPAGVEESEAGEAPSGVDAAVAGFHGSS